MSDTSHDPVAITSTALLIDLLTLSYRIQTRYLHRLPHVSLPPLQLLLLFIADSRPDKTIRPSKVAHALGLSMSTVSEAIRKLRHKRFLMRTDTVTDGRHKGYQLTLKGHEPLRISRSEWTRLTSHLSRASHASLQEQLTALTLGLQLDNTRRVSHKRAIQ